MVGDVVLARINGYIALYLVKDITLKNGFHSQYGLGNNKKMRGWVSGDSIFGMRTEKP
jgi:hypothetical protein